MTVSKPAHAPRLVKRMKPVKPGGASGTLRPITDELRPGVYEAMQIAYVTGIEFVCSAIMQAMDEAQSAGRSLSMKQVIEICGDTAAAPLTVVVREPEGVVLQ